MCCKLVILLRAKTSANPGRLWAVVEGRGGVGRVDLTGEEYSPCRQGYMPGSSVLLVNVRYAGSETLPSVEEVRQQIGEGEEVEGVVVEDGERREGSEDKRDECNSDVASQRLLSWRSEDAEPPESRALRSRREIACSGAVE